MNKVILMGRLTGEPEVRYTTGETQTCVARYRLAVNRRFKKDEADFINCTAFSKQGEFAEKYLRKGTKILVSGRIQTGSYQNREGIKVYTTDVIIEEQEFAGSKAQQAPPKQEAPKKDDFMDIPDGIESELPFV